MHFFGESSCIQYYCVSSKNVFLQTNSDLRRIIEDVHLPFSSISIRQVEVFSAHTPLSSFDANNIELNATAAREYFVSLEN